MVELTEEQKGLRQNILSWLDYGEPGSRMALSGYAGTGKTTLVNDIIHHLAANTSKYCDKPKRIAVCAPTGKASSVLQKKLLAAQVPLQAYDCNTMHSLLFIPKEDCDYDTLQPDLDFVLKNPIDLLDNYFLIIIDEASMLSNDMFQKLERVDTPILLVGDPGQLAPVNGETVPLLRNTPNKLVTVHRQALDNPIIRLATDIRQGKRLYPVRAGTELNVTLSNKPEVPILRKKFLEHMLRPEVIMLVGKNAARVAENKTVRQAHGFESHNFPQPGEKVVCLANDSDARIMNGQLFFVVASESINGDFYFMEIVPEESANDPKSRRISVVASRVSLHNPDTQAANLHRRNFLNRRYFKSLAEEFQCCNSTNIAYFDYGYCLSVHKAQGSEWSTVLFLNDHLYRNGPDPREYTRWLYTGVTRAKKSLIMIA